MFEPMLFVKDVEATSRWYQAVLGLRSAHGGPFYEMLTDADGKLVLQLHRIDADEHGHRDPAGGVAGAGVLLYFRTPDVRALHAHARSHGATVESEPAFAAQAGHTEFVLRDPDGYALAIYQPGEA